MWFNLIQLFSCAPFQGTKSIPHFHDFIHFKDTKRRVGLNALDTQYTSTETGRFIKRKSFKTQQLQTGMKRVL